MNLGKAVKITKVKLTVATGTTTINSDIVDMQGYDGVLFLASIGTAAADNGVKAQQGAASNMSDAADLAGTKILSDATQKEFVLDIYRPLERYMRLAVIRPTTTTIEAVWAIQYQGNKKPVSNVTTAQATEVHVSPAEGTA